MIWHGLMQCGMLGRPRSFSLKATVNGKMDASGTLLLLSERVHSSSEFLAGRSDSNVKVVFPKIELHGMETTIHGRCSDHRCPASGDCDVSKSVPRPGEYVVVNIDSATQRSMVGTPVRRTSLQAVGNV